MVTIVKAGKLYRLSTVLRRWKDAWFALYEDGSLRYFESENDFVPKATIRLARELVRILTQPQTPDPPPGRTRECVFGISTVSSGDWYFCAESPDGAVAWRMALAEARNATRLPVQPPPYIQHINQQTGSPVYQGIPTIYRGVDGEVVVPHQVIEHPDGSRTIILGEGRSLQCYCRHGYDCGCGYNYAGAAMMGLAASSLMLSPFFWGPCWW